jgi:hypothetical protein
MFVFNPLSGQLDAVNKQADPAYYQYIYNSSGSQAGNRFNDWADLITAIDGRKAIISFEQNETLPTGSWFHNNIQWSGTGQNPDQGAPVITLPTGFTFSNATNWNAENGLNIESTSVNPIYVQSIATTHLFDRVFIGAYNAPFFEVTSNGLHAFAVFNGGQYVDYGYPIVQETTADPYGAIIVFAEQGVGPKINDNTLATTNPQIVLNLKQSAILDDRVATYAGLNPAGVLQNQLFANASVIGFKNGNPTGITSDNVTDALSELEARIAILEAYH